MNFMCSVLAILALSAVSISALQCHEYVTGSLLNDAYFRDDGLVECDSHVKMCFRVKGEGKTGDFKAGDFDAAGCDEQAECQNQKLSDGQCKSFEGEVGTNLHLETGKMCCNSDHLALANV